MMKKSDHVKIMEFIENFKYGFSKDSIEKIFLFGNCYHFAVILENLFKSGTIVYEPVEGHFLYQYGGRYYDVTGCKNLENTPIPLWMIEREDPLLYSRLKRDCMFKEKTS